MSEKEEERMEARIVEIVQVPASDAVCRCVLPIADDGWVMSSFCMLQHFCCIMPTAATDGSVLFTIRCKLIFNVQDRTERFSLCLGFFFLSLFL